MRLLDTATFEIHEYFGSQIPFYAILSHRWGDGEVTFQDLKSEGRVDMAGWTKITGCCSQARKDGWKYAWIDSCCIDKSSSAELSEAINSMFEWYKNAQVCYAYLSDVAENEKDHEREASAFRNSTWWTRGWTLQELLAPDSIVFFNCSWIEVGTKGSCYKLISSITHIDQEFLWGFNEASIAQKMSWASNRDTLRAEDMAYCLMGLFGVNMPLLYGEGGQAFMRLQLEIMKISDDESLFAWASGSNPRQTSGLLAYAPTAFRVSHRIKQTFLRRHEPYLMTNKGLQITLPLYQIEWEETPPILPPPRTTFVYYRARLNCNLAYSDQAVLVKLRATVGHRTETYTRIDCHKLEFEDPIDSATNPTNPDNRQIFVYQPPQFLSMNQGIFVIDVHTGPLLDREFIMRTGFGSYLLQNVEHKEVVYAREWMFRLSTWGVQSIAVEGPRGAFVLNISNFISFGTRQTCLSIELLSAKQYKSRLSSSQWITGPVLASRRDRATLMLRCGDIVSATLKKAPRGSRIVYILDFDYVSAEA